MEFQIIAGDVSLDFLNTLEHRISPENQKELLLSYPDLADWATQARVLTSRRRGELVRDSILHPREAQIVLHKTIEFRECMYRIVVARLRKRPPVASDLSLFSRYLSQALSHLSLQATGSRFRIDWNDSPSRLDSILWPIVRAASELLTAPDMENVRECDSPSCRWLFVDRSKNHSRRWCDMKVCGNRVKARRFYRRQSQPGKTARGAGRRD